MRFFQPVSFILFFALSVHQVSATNRLVIQSFHRGKPVDVQWHKKSGMLLSVGQDGILIVTDPKSRKILHRIKVTNGKSHLFRSDPTGNRIALISSKNDLYTLSVWDWNDEKELYRFSLNAQPLYISWSTKGKYLVAGKIDTPNILIIESKTGRQLSYLKNVSSLYNMGYIGRTEKILMAYSSTGVIHYWDISASVLKMTVSTLPDLQNIIVLQTGEKLNLLARKSDTLYTINRQTGAVQSKLSIPKIIDTVIDASNGYLDVLVKTDSGLMVQQFTIIDGDFIDRDYKPAKFLLQTTSPPVSITRDREHAYIATSSGELLQLTESGLSEIIRDILWYPQDSAFYNDEMYISNSRRIVRFTSPFFNTNSHEDSSNLEELTNNLTMSGLPVGDTGLEIIPNGDVLLWAEQTADRGIKVLDFNHPANMKYLMSNTMIHELEIIDSEQTLTVDNTGTIRISDTQNGMILNEYTSLGILDASYSSDGNFVLAGRSVNKKDHASLERIDMSTKESSPISDNRFIVYSITSDEQFFYTLGASRKSRTEMTTELRAHDIEDPAISRLLARIDGEDFNAIVIPNQSSGGVYTTLGGAITRINGDQRKIFEWDEQIISLHEHGNLLYGIDAGGRLILWDKKRGKQALLSVSFFKGDLWLAQSPNRETIWTTEEALGNFILYSGNRELDPSRLKNLNILDLN